jgi:hypothetical protein
LNKNDDFNEYAAAGWPRRRRRTDTLLTGCCALVALTAVVRAVSLGSTPNPSVPATSQESTTSSVPSQTPANERLEVGATAELILFLHCGVRYATIDGTTWETSPRGGGSAPDGWPERLTGTATRTTDDTVVFSSPPLVDEMVFHPAADPSDFVCY